MLLLLITGIMHNLIIVNIIIKLKTLFVTQSHPLFKGQNVASEQLQTIPIATFGISIQLLN